MRNRILGKKLPEWVSQLAVAWKHLDIPPVLFLEHLALIEKSCSCDAVLLVKDGTLLLKGLDSALAILKQSPEVHLCAAASWRRTALCMELGHS